MMAGFISLTNMIPDWHQGHNHRKLSVSKSDHTWLEGHLIIEIMSFCKVDHRFAGLKSTTK